MMTSMIKGESFRVSWLPHIQDLGAATFEEFLHVHEEIRDRAPHDQLQKDLIEHQSVLAGIILEDD
jgi:hypothetical protein